MYNNYINPYGANISKSYILKSKDGIEKYFSKVDENKYIPSQLIKATIFENHDEAKQIAEMLEKSGNKIEIIEMQNRTRW